MEKLCLCCDIKFEPISNRNVYCSIECKNKNAFLKNQEKIISNGQEDIDYVIDKWNGYVTPRIYGVWMKSMHPGKTTADYLNEFPGSSLACSKDKEATTKNAGQHMKDPKYRKMASDAMLGNKNPNHISNTNDEIRKSRSPFSVKFEKYTSEEDRDSFIKSIDWNSRLTSTQLRWWLDKGYTSEEAKELLKQRQTTFSLDKCVHRYGEKEGLKIFNERQVKWKKSLQENFEREGDGRSPSSKFANSIIRELCLYLNIEIPKKEKWMMCKETKKAYSYDFTYKKKIIEFNGDYWHCNPLLYEEDFFNKNKELTAEEIWQYDLAKNRLAESHGYKVLVVWENEWMKEPDHVIKKCIDFIND
jgi:hypothetical protein